MSIAWYVPAFYLFVGLGIGLMAGYGLRWNQTRVRIPKPIPLGGSSQEEVEVDQWVAQMRDDTQDDLRLKRPWQEGSKVLALTAKPHQLTHSMGRIRAYVATYQQPEGLRAPKRKGT